jgi:hypothetical protein
MSSTMTSFNYLIDKTHDRAKTSCICLRLLWNLSAAFFLVMLANHLNDQSDGVLYLFQRQMQK